MNLVSGPSGSINLKVTVSVDFSGFLRPQISSNEISIGSIAMPNSEMSWQELDSRLIRLFNVFSVCNKIDNNYHSYQIFLKYMFIAIPNVIFV